jgi:hypothetical protein
LSYYTYRCTAANTRGWILAQADIEAETEDELWKHIKTHAAVAHGEEPETVGALIKTV